MSDVSQGPGWWIASDGKWYPPQAAPGFAVPVPTLAPGGPVGPVAPKKRRRRLIAAIVVGVVIVLGIVGAVLAGNSVSPNSLSVGACVNDLTPVSSKITKVSTVTKVDCSKPHHYELIALQKNDAGDNVAYPGDDALRSESQTFCRAQFETYVGVTYDSSSYDLTELWPSSDSWGAGDRTEECFAGLSNGELTGSVKGTNK